MPTSVLAYQKKIHAVESANWVMLDLLKDYLKQHTAGCCCPTADAISQDLEDAVREAQTQIAANSGDLSLLVVPILSYYGDATKQNAELRGKANLNPNRTHIPLDSDFARLIFAFCLAYPSIVQSQVAYLEESIECVDEGKSRNFKTEMDSTFQARATTTADAARRGYISKLERRHHETSTPLRAALTQKAASRGLTLSKIDLSVHAQATAAQSLALSTEQLATDHLSKQLDVQQQGWGKLFITSIFKLNCHFTAAFNTNPSRESLKLAIGDAIIYCSFLSTQASKDELMQFIDLRSQTHDGEAYSENREACVTKVARLYLEAFLKSIQLLSTHPLIDGAGKKLGREALDKLRSFDLIEHLDAHLTELSYPKLPDHGEKIVNTAHQTGCRAQIKSATHSARSAVLGVLYHTAAAAAQSHHHDDKSTADTAALVFED